MTGLGLLETDSMSLAALGGKEPLRCVVSRSGGLDLGQPLFQQPGGPIHLLVTDPPASFSTSELEKAGVSVHTGTLSKFLEVLAAIHQVTSLHCEGGGELVRNLAELDAIDEIHLIWAAHMLIGGADMPTLSDLPGLFLPASRRFALVAWHPNGAGECFLHYSRIC